MNKKIIAFVLAGVFAISMAGPVGATTIGELQVLYDEMLANYNLLLAQVGQSTVAVGVCFDADLQQGMTSDDVKALQIKLGVIPTSGYFGPITLAAVKTFQTANGVINTGYVGPLTRGVLNGLYCTVVPAVTYPAGCTSAVGYSSTTGLLCAGEAVTYPAGCTSAVGFSPTTGLSCAGDAVEVVTYPAGCTSAVGFSPTTGLSCAGTTTTTVAVVATEGTLTVTQYAIPGSGTVSLYGDNVQKEVAAYKVKATNSAIRVKRALVQFDLTSDFPWRDLTYISLWDGSTMLKEMPVNQTNCTEIVFATTYQMTIDGLDVLVAKDTEKILTLKASAVSVPQYASTIYVSFPANAVRGIDSAALNVYGPATAISASSHYFTTATAQAPTITTTASIDSPLAGNFIASASTITRVDLMKINVKVEAVDMIFKGGSITVDTNAATTMSAIELYDGTTLLASVAVTTGAFSWSTFTLPVSADTTKVLTVKGVVKANPTATSGVGVSLVSTTGLTGIDASGAARNNTGAITGSTLTVYTAAPVFALASASTVISDSTTSTINDVGDFTIGISVTANSGDIYIPTVTHATYGTAGAVEGIFQSVTTSGTETATSSYWTCDASAVEDDTNKVWRIPSGATSVCTYEYHVVNTVAASYYTVGILNIKWATSAGMVTGYVAQTTGISALKAPAKNLAI